MSFETMIPERTDQLDALRDSPRHNRFPFAKRPELFAERLAPLNLNGEEGRRLPGEAETGDSSPHAPIPCHRELRNAAQAIGDRLAALALRRHHSAFWIGPTRSAQRHTCPPPALDLYAGQGGIVLFLAYLGAVTGETRYTELAQAGLLGLLPLLQIARNYETAIGGFTGWGGVVYLLTHLSRLWKETYLEEEAHEVVDFLPPLIAQDEHLQLIDGAAGCLVALLGLHTLSPSSATMRMATTCGERLLAQRRIARPGIAWKLGPESCPPLSGFGYGTAGIAWALQQLAAATGESGFHRAALCALAFERSRFVSQAGNWLDRCPLPGAAPDSEVTTAAFRTAWCHGAPGIGLARLHALPLQDDLPTRREIEIALETTYRAGFGHSHCLCYGDLGNIELLAMAGRTFPNTVWRQRAERRAADILTGIAAYGWRCGPPARLESLGLMTGLAGIGYGLLRLAAPEQVPSVLLLESPIRALPPSFVPKSGGAL